MALDGDESFVHQLSPLDHLSPRVHTPKLLYFATNEEPASIFSTLCGALSKTITAFPILRGSVGLMKGASQTGTLAIQAPFFNAKDILTEKDLRNEYDYDTIRASHFPSDAVDGAMVMPDWAENPSRVFFAQVNYIRGGLVLACAIHHCVVDETGISNLMKLWSSYCRGDNGAALVKPEWMDRTSLMAGRGSGRLEDHIEYKPLPAEQSATHSATSVEYISQTSNTTGSAILFFSDESLKRLKKAAIKDFDHISKSTQETIWISTNDALCALIWSRVTRARNLNDEVKYSMFNMVVNGRSRLNPPLSPEYTGNVIFVSSATLPIDALAAPTCNLADAALAIRKSILTIDDKVIKDKIKAVVSVDDIGRLAPGGYSSFQRGLGCTSWSEQPYYALDWGKTLGGRCKRIRWRSNISDGIFVIFPRLPNTEESFGGGGFEIYLGLQRDHLERLKQDEIFSQYAEWRHSN